MDFSNSWQASHGYSLKWLDTIYTPIMVLFVRSLQQAFLGQWDSRVIAEASLSEVMSQMGTDSHRSAARNSNQAPGNGVNQDKMMVSGQEDQGQLKTGCTISSLISSWNTQCVFNPTSEIVFDSTRYFVIWSLIEECCIFNIFNNS